MDAKEMIKDDRSAHPEVAASNSKWNTTVRPMARRASTLRQWQRRVSHAADPKLWSATNILRYDTGKLQTWGYLLIFSGTAISKNSILGTCGLAVVSTFLGYFRCRDDILPGWNSLCVPAVGDEALMLTSLVAFLLGMFGSLTFSRWWATREKLQQVIGRTNNLAVMIATYVVGDDHLTNTAREEMCRYMNLAHALVYKQASMDEDLGELIGRRLLTKDEARKIENLPSKYLIIYTWLADLLKEVALNGRLVYPEYVLPLMHGDISVMRGGASDIFMYLNCQIPYSYVHMLTLVSKIHVLFVVLYVGGLIGRGFIERSVMTIVFGYCFLFATRIIYEGLLQIHHSLVNPFGDDPDDFPRLSYQEGLRQTCEAILSQVNQTPCHNFFQEQSSATETNDQSEDASAVGASSGPRRSRRKKKRLVRRSRSDIITLKEMLDQSHEDRQHIREAPLNAIAVPVEVGSVSDLKSKIEAPKSAAELLSIIPECSESVVSTSELEAGPVVGNDVPGGSTQQTENLTLSMNGRLPRNKEAASFIVSAGRIETWERISGGMGDVGPLDPNRIAPFQGSRRTSMSDEITRSNSRPRSFSSDVFSSMEMAPESLLQQIPATHPEPEGYRWTTIPVLVPASSDLHVTNPFTSDLSIHDLPAHSHLQQNNNNNNNIIAASRKSSTDSSESASLLSILPKTRMPLSSTSDPSTLSKPRSLEALKSVPMQVHRPTLPSFQQQQQQQQPAAVHQSKVSHRVTSRPSASSATLGSHVLDPQRPASMHIHSHHHSDIVLGPRFISTASDSVHVGSEEKKLMQSAANMPWTSPDGQKALTRGLQRSVSFHGNARSGEENSPKSPRSEADASASELEGNSKSSFDSKSVNSKTPSDDEGRNKDEGLVPVDNRRNVFYSSFSVA
eukprot:CAMPEP_0184662198 /NCGR_PEP_ID=MMETSP0308-20130426/42033_1 /TAXON_ID=38269 /ORGANISM="Gloeochaete witrockiana, Strain SAG 46.84" /LENGTH=901 /DNA_ID=CAMNT_0027104031 /DNA_START=163 /DNA_END=2867 /DNA_ORIENTATION=-